MNRLKISLWIMLAIVFVGGFYSVSAQSDTVTVQLYNQGSALEGHTPRGFQGQGTGLFVGDNFNPSFPDGDGVQVFLTFDHSELPSGEIVSAKLYSEHAHVSGSPFTDLGNLIIEEVRFMEFSSELWDSQVVPDGSSCVFGTSQQGPFECDVTTMVKHSINEGHPYAQFRLRFEQAGDNDGLEDVVFFFVSDSNTNEPGIFTLELEVAASQEQKPSGLEKVPRIVQSLILFALAIVLGFVTVWVSNKTAERMKQTEKRPKKRTRKKKR